MIRQRLLVIGAAKGPVVQLFAANAQRLVRRRAGRDDIAVQRHADVDKNFAHFTLLWLRSADTTKLAGRTRHEGEKTSDK